jgi:hypothetical protein
MFELHMGDDLTVLSSTVNSPLLVLGSQGQGKSVFLIQMVLELIQNEETGFLYDPYGDLAAAIQEHVQSDECQERVTFVTHAEYANQKSGTREEDQFIVVSGTMLESGVNATRELGLDVLERALKEASPNDWIIIDETSEFLSDEIFSAYLQSSGSRCVLSDRSLMRYSSQQREALLNAAQQVVLYKPRKIDGKWIEEMRGAPTAKDTAAIKQYHYYWIDGAESRYTKSPWPIEKI